MDRTDKKILNRIQSGFPVDSRPFEAVAFELGLTEKEVIKRVGALKEAGIIRRIGGNFVPGKLGHVSTLCAARVPEDEIDAFARVVNRYKGVTHNYEREGDYNVWFTFIAPSEKDIQDNLKKISADTGIENILNLPAEQVYKIKAHFNL